MTNAAIAPAEKKARSFADLFLWWLILVIFAAAALLLPARRANAQETAGPLPAVTPSDQPPPSPRASAPAQIGGKPNLSGTWALNKDESDDPREAMHQESGNSGGHGGGGGVHVGMGGGMGGGGWGGGGQRGGGGAGGGGRRGGQGGSGDAMNNLSQLTIEQTASSAKVTGDSGEVLALYSAAESSKATPSSASSPSASSGSGSTSSSGDSASASPAAQWQGTQLVAVTPGRREGSKTTRTYELSPDGKQLYMTTKMESPRFKKPVTFRLVYDPAQSGG